MQLFGIGLGTQIYRYGILPEIIVGHDYRAYSKILKQALITGLIQAGIRVKDIGLAISPMAYFSQFHLDVSAVAMLTASHNPNGWTGVKVGFDKAITHSPDQILELRHIIFSNTSTTRSGGNYAFVRNILHIILTIYAKILSFRDR